MDTAHGDVRRPTISYRDMKTGLFVTLHASVPSALVSPAKLAPSRNCLRSAQIPSGLSGSDSEPAATPIYNYSVLGDMFYHKHCLCARKILAPARLTDTARLLQLWVVAQVPASIHRPRVVDAVVMAVASAVQQKTIVRTFTALVCVSKLVILNQFA
jgi:hypothetical protein